MCEEISYQLEVCKNHYKKENSVGSSVQRKNALF